MCIGKDRRFLFPHKNFRFRLLRILIVLLCLPSSLVDETPSLKFRIRNEDKT